MNAEDAKVSLRAQRVPWRIFAFNFVAFAFGFC
jgi:hypothetical protein